MQSKTAAAWEVVPGETLHLVFRIHFVSPKVVAPVSQGFPVFVRWDGKQYVNVALRHGQPLTVFCSCHPNQQRFGRLILVGKESAPHIELVSEQVFSLGCGRELLSLERFRDEHSLPKALVW